MQHEDHVASHFKKTAMNILCITHSGDYYTIDIVEKALALYGARMLRFDTDRFGADGDFSFHLDTSNGGSQKIKIGAVEFDTPDAVWYRKIWKLSVPAKLSPDYHAVFTKEYQTWMRIFFESLAGIPWMNPMEEDHSAGTNKMKQLRLAKRAGLTIPSTLSTNNPELVRNFFDEHHGKIIMKLHNALSKSMKGDQPFFPTTLVQENHLAQLSSLRYCPMIFQEQVQKKYELRIAYVDGHFFTGKINTQHLEHGQTDWRATKHTEAAWELYELPIAIQSKIDSLMRSLHLGFGLIDMIRSTDGEYVFLEVNPQGEWGMLQRDLGYKIGEQIAETLVKKVNNETTISTHHYA
jgi:glutathione synthase/RimK-type ligase-like ATP-grasp enzyme